MFDLLSFPSKMRYWSSKLFLNFDLFNFWWYSREEATGIESEAVSTKEAPFLKSNENLILFEVEFSAFWTFRGDGKS